VERSTDYDLDPELVDRDRQPPDHAVVRYDGVATRAG
jgi:hypothetical protein